jgi:hypothetical protein
MKFLSRNNLKDSLRSVILLQIWRRKFSKIKKKLPTNEIFKKNILIATNIGGNLNTLALDVLLGLALKSRGHKVIFSICDGILPGCMNCEINKYIDIEEFFEFGSKKLCGKCFSTGQKIMKMHSLDFIKLSDYLNQEPGQPAARSSGFEGAIRFLAISESKRSKHFSAVKKIYDDSSTIAQNSLRNLVEANSVDLIIAHHGIYVPQGDVVKVAKELKIEIVTWNQAYRKNCFIFSRGDTYHKTLLNDPDCIWSKSEAEINEVVSYLESRDIGTNDWINYSFTNKDLDDVAFALPFSEKKSVLLLTNVGWDAQLHYSGNCFLNMNDWIIQTIDWFCKNPSLNLIVRIHPAEVTGRIKSQDRVIDLITKKFPVLPKNIVIVEPSHRVSTYRLIEKCDLALIYGTKTGVELAARGKTVITAGDAWIKNKGISLDPKSSDEYFGLLEKFEKSELNFALDQRRALSYAHYFFYNKMIPIKSVSALPRYPYILPNLEPGWEEFDPGLLQLVQSLEEGKPLFYRFSQ